MGLKNQKVKFKNTKLNQKLLKHLIKNGNKKTCEKTLLKSLKSVQKESKKNHIELIKWALLNSMTTLKIKTLRNKKTKKKTEKKIPVILIKKDKRISYTIKLIISEIKNKKGSYPIYLKIKQEILDSSKNSSNSINNKIEIQKQALSYKRYLSNYKWKKHV